MLSNVLPPFLATVISLILTRYLSSEKSFVNIIDIPNDRSMHSGPIPRTGGIAINLSILSGIILTFIYSNDIAGFPIILVTGMLIMLVVSFLDDVYSLSPLFRIAVHFAVACIIVFSGLSIPDLSMPGIDIVLSRTISIVFSVLTVVWLINLYNFMDGMDGFSGGMAFSGFLTMAILLMDKSSFMAMICLVIAMSAFGFLIYNYPPAKIFMGDTGSTVLGFFAAYMIIYAARIDAFPFWVGVLIFSPFIVDATFTLLLRLLRRERIWKAHNRHLYQILANRYIGKKWTLYTEYTLMFLCSISAVIAMQMPEARAAIFSCWLIVYLAIIIGIYGYDKVRIGNNR